MKASVIILNWNGKHYLGECLTSLKKQTFKDFETILVDNGSSDGSVTYVKKNFPKVRIIKNKKNLGFAEGNNIGIRAARGSYIVTLNNDTFVDKNFLNELVKVAESDKKIGMVAAKIFFPDKTIDSFGHNALISGFSRDSKNSKDGRIFSPCACAALYKREMLEDIKIKDDYFDSDFFAYYEDFDLGFRARLRGWKVMLADAVVYHKHAGTAGVYTNFSIYYGNRNPLLVVIKNYPTAIFFLYSPAIILVQFLSLLKYALRGKFFLALKAKINAFVNIKKFVEKRKIIQKHKIITDKEFRALLTKKLF